jgi:hypothetical protein
LLVFGSELKIGRDEGARFVRCKSEGKQAIPLPPEGHTRAFALQGRLAFPISVDITGDLFFCSVDWLLPALVTATGNRCARVHRLHHQTQSHSLPHLCEPAMEPVFGLSIGIMHRTIHGGDHSRSQRAPSRTTPDESGFRPESAGEFSQELVEPDRVSPGGRPVGASAKIS